MSLGALATAAYAKSPIQDQANWPRTPTHAAAEKEQTPEVPAKGARRDGELEIAGGEKRRRAESRESGAANGPGSDS